MLRGLQELPASRRSIPTLYPAGQRVLRLQRCKTVGGDYLARQVGFEESENYVYHELGSSQAPNAPRQEIPSRPTGGVGRHGPRSERLSGHHSIHHWPVSWSRGHHTERRTALPCSLAGWGERIQVLTEHWRPSAVQSRPVLSWWSLNSHSTKTISVALVVVGCCLTSAWSCRARLS